jgi:hypothetical protein
LNIEENQFLEKEEFFKLAKLMGKRVNDELSEEDIEAIFYLMDTSHSA